MAPKSKGSLDDDTPRAILCLDGGGLRGALAAGVLEVVEEELNHTPEHDAPTTSGCEPPRKVLIGKAFRLCAGTSTGALLSAYLTTYCEPDWLPDVAPEDSTVPRGSAMGSYMLFEDHAKTIFPRRMNGCWLWRLAAWLIPCARGAIKRLFLHYSPNGLEAVLKKLYTKKQDDECNKDKYLSLADVAGDKKRAGLREKLSACESSEKKLEEVERRLNSKLQKQGSPKGASLFIVSHNVSSSSPVAFIADRESKTAKYVPLDALSLPFMGDREASGEDGNRLDDIVDSFNQWKEEEQKKVHEDSNDSSEHKWETVIDLANLGDALPAPQLTLEYALKAVEKRKKPYALKDVRMFIRDLQSHRFQAVFTDINLWEVLRCSTAAPTFFPPMVVDDILCQPARMSDADKEKVKLEGGGKVVKLEGGEVKKGVFCDGGVAANNPASAALAYLVWKDITSLADTKPNESVKFDLSKYPILSIGCGAAYSNLDIAKAASLANGVGWLTRGELVDILMKNSPSLAHLALTVQRRKL
eukprot:scaffold7234_cov335-Prasinococcus_capsulatus_cf.AAC.6